MSWRRPSRRTSCMVKLHGVPRELGGTPKLVGLTQQTHGIFPTKNDHFWGGDWGETHHFFGNTRNGDFGWKFPQSSGMFLYLDMGLSCAQHEPLFIHTWLVCKSSIFLIRFFFGLRSAKKMTFSRWPYQILEGLIRGKKCQILCMVGIRILVPAVLFFFLKVFFPLKVKKQPFFFRIYILIPPKKKLVKHQTQGEMSHRNLHPESAHILFSLKSVDLLLLSADVGPLFGSWKHQKNIKKNTSSRLEVKKNNSSRFDLQRLRQEKDGSLIHEEVL